MSNICKYSTCSYHTLESVDLFLLNIMEIEGYLQRSPPAPFGLMFWAKLTPSHMILGIHPEPDLADPKLSLKYLRALLQQDMQIGSESYGMRFSHCALYLFMLKLSIPACVLGGF